MMQPSARLQLSVFIITLSCCCISQCRDVEQVQTELLEPNVVQYFTIHPKETIKFQLRSVYSPNTSFVVFQTHAYSESVTLSTTLIPTHNTSVTGRDVGLVTVHGTATGGWYLSANQTQLADNFRVLVLASLFGRSVPIPGGCNMEFPVENDPNLHVMYEHGVNKIQFQFARQTYPPSKSCDVQDQTALTYNIYQKYLEPGENGTFTAIEEMLTDHGVITYGDQMYEFAISDKTEKYFAAFEGKGVVYNVRVTQQNNKTLTSIAYIPVVSHACLGETVQCSYLDGKHAFALIIAFLFGLVGLFICFFGHRFFKTEMFIFGFLAMFIISSILFARYVDLNISVLVLLALLCGAVCGMMWFSLWYYKGIPVLSVLLVGLVGGYLVSCMVFNLTTFGNISWWQSSMNYGLMFASFVLLPSVIFLTFSREFNIACCSVVGGYLVVFAMDIFIRGNITQIVLLSVKKAVWRDMLPAMISLPYQWSDLVLALIWIFLAVGGATFQYLRERHRAPFPPCPWQQRRLKNDRVSVRQPSPPAEGGDHVAPVAGTCDPYEGDEDTEDENEPLIQARQQMERQMTEWTDSATVNKQ